MADKDSGSEDDYMSECILSNLNDVRPGINFFILFFFYCKLGISAHNRSHQRTLRIEANRELAKKKFDLPKKKDLERNRLEEGLNKPICTESKGFSLLAKMGYTLGMSLGKKREGNFFCKIINKKFL